MPQLIGNNGIEFYMGPHTIGGPDNLEELLLNFIRVAKKSLDIAVQELDSKIISEEILKASLRGVRVRIILESDYLKNKRQSITPFRLGGKQEINREIFNALLRANVDIKSDFNPYTFHQKFIIRDNESLLTGSGNFTDSGVSTNANHFLVVHDKKIVKIYKKEFNELQKGRFGRHAHTKVPKEVKVQGIRLKVLFAPSHNPEMEIMKQMLKAEKRIDFAVYSFSNSSGIDDTLLALRGKGIEIRGLLDGNQAAQKWAPTKALHDSGVKLFVTQDDDIFRKLHYKMIIIDQQVLITGNYNFSRRANQLNDENIIVAGEKKNVTEQQLQLSSFALAEMDRIIDKYSNPYST